MNDYAMHLPQVLGADAVCVIDDNDTLASRIAQAGRFSLSATSSQTHPSGQLLATLRMRHAAYLSLHAQGADTGVVWASFATPVTQTADLRDVRISALPEISNSEAAAIETSVNALLSEDADPALGNLKFVAMPDSNWYMTSELAAGPEFAADPPRQLLGQPLRDFPITGRDSRQIKRLQTELQMLLHQHPVNAARLAEGLAPVNALWMHGAGARPEPHQCALPPLRAASAAWRGVWQWVGAPLLDATTSTGSTYIALASECADQIFEQLLQGQLKNLLVVTREAQLVLGRRKWWHQWFPAKPRAGR